MILVADSGSTKCDWMFCDTNGFRLETHSMGINPMYHNEDFIVNELSKVKDLTDNAAKTLKVFFYGAGCSHPERNDIVFKALSRIFKNANIIVNHDMNGAALAACLGKEGVACILGTGSNSCYFDGENVIPSLGGIGFRLGDEGSGAYFGKKLVVAYMYERLPENMFNYMKNELKLEKETIIENVYSKPFENTYMASFMKIYTVFKEEEWVKKTVLAGFTEFADYHITYFKNYKEVPVNFVGSVSYYFKDIMEIVAKNFGFTIGNVTNKPIIGLVKYHLETENLILNSK